MHTQREFSMNTKTIEMPSETKDIIIIARILQHQ